MKPMQRFLPFAIYILQFVLPDVSAFTTTKNTRSFALGRQNYQETQLSMWSNNDDIEGTDKIKACIPYILPLIDGDHFGNYLYQRIPALGMADYVLLQPIINLVQVIPFSTLILFLALSLGTRSDRFSRGVRFNAQQAVLIDVALIVPELIGGSMDGSDIPRYIMEPCANFTYYFYMSLVVYSIVSNLRGRKPNQIPFFSAMAERAVGPF